MPEIIRVEYEQLPERRLIGIRYSDSDRDENCGFGTCWELWNRGNRCAPLYPLMLPGPTASACLGFMRNPETGFEYWIGRFCRPDAPAPEGYDFLDLPAGGAAIVSIRGRRDDRAIYGMHDACIAAAGTAGFRPAEPPVFFERYTERFNRKDPEGNVVLEYGISVSPRQ